MNDALNQSMAKYIIAKKNILAPRRSLNDFEMDKLVRKPEKSDYSSKIFRTVVLFGCYFAFGFSRSLQGPTMLELEKQVNGSSSTFQTVFLLAAITYPLGNILSGFLMERVSPSLVLFVSTLVLAFSNCFVPFSTSIPVLAISTGFAELALGLIDTGVNVYCLQIWGDKSGPYFNALHLAQGVGFLMAPILAETVLPSAYESEMLGALNLSDNFDEALKVSMDTMPEFGKDFMLNPLQALYLSIAFTTLIVAICFIAGIPADLMPKDKEEVNGEKKEKKTEDGKNKPFVLAITGAMAFYSFCSYGVTFAFGHFLTAFAVKGSLQVSPRDGARMTSFYYAAQVFIRGLNIFLVDRFMHFQLIVFSLGLVAFGTFVLYAAPVYYGALIGSVIVGLGAGSLFPMGLLYIQSKMELSGRVTGLFCLGASIGAQIFRFPEAAFIQDVPMVHLYLLTVGCLASCASFYALYHLAEKRVKYENNLQEEFEKAQIKARVSEAKLW